MEVLIREQNKVKYFIERDNVLRNELAVYRVEKYDSFNSYDNKDIVTLFYITVNSDGTYYFNFGYEVDGGVEFKSLDHLVEMKDVIDAVIDYIERNY